MTLCHWHGSYNGRSAFDSWMGPMLNWHINCIEIMAVFLAFKSILSRSEDSPHPGTIEQHDSDDSD